jgi:hypothetical protein
MANEEINTMSQEQVVGVGDFIYVPAWEARGQVVAVESARRGSLDAQQVLLQEKPESRGRWYTLEPNEFQLD